MAYQQQKFHTEGSSALKSEGVEFDVFVKPRFISERNDAPIIDISNAYGAGHASAEDRAHDGYKGLRTRFMDVIKQNRLLGDLFTDRKRNSYLREDIIIFAKGFSVTGVTAFFLILFGA